MLRSQIQDYFKEHYQRPAEYFVSAPARVNLIGDHTDYNLGFVLPCAINYKTYIGVAPRSDQRIRVTALNHNKETHEFSLSQPIEHTGDEHWANYILGVVKILLAEGFQLKGADIAINSDIPEGAGLSSSAALEVALIKALVNDDSLISPLHAAQIGQRAENEFVGCQCGIMDQLICADGKEGSAQLIDCNSLSRSPIALPDSLAILIINSNVKRGLVDSEYNLRRTQCEAVSQYFNVPSLREVSLEQLTQAKNSIDPIQWQRAYHVLTENARVLAFVKALETQDISALGPLMEASHQSLKDNFEVTVEPIDTLVQQVKRVIGNSGGVRMTGGGFGGCVVALAPHNSVDAIKQSVNQQYFKATGLNPTFYLAKPANGAFHA